VYYVVRVASSGKVYFHFCCFLPPRTAGKFTLCCVFRTFFRRREFWTTQDTVQVPVLRSCGANNSCWIATFGLAPLATSFSEARLAVAVLRSLWNTVDYRQCCFMPPECHVSLAAKEPLSSITARKLFMGNSLENKITIIMPVERNFEGALWLVLKFYLCQGVIIQMISL